MCVCVCVCFGGDKIRIILHLGHFSFVSFVPNGITYWAFLVAIKGFENMIFFSCLILHHYFA